MKTEQSYFSSCLYFATNSLARTLTRLAEDHFSLTGLSPSYAFVLIAINRKPGISPSKVAQELQMQPSTITRFLDKLEARGLIFRETNGKQSNLFPTAKSEELNPKLIEAWEQLTDSYEETLGINMAKLLTNNITEAKDRLTS